MKFYRLKNSIENIGEAGYPQSQTIELENGRTVKDDDFIWKVYWNEKPDFKPYIGTIVLNDKSLLTDFISSATVSGFLCNQRAKDILSKLSNDNTFFYPLSVQHKEIIYNDYFFLHCIKDISGNVDFVNSKFQFYYRDGLTKITTEVKITDPIQLEELTQKLLFRQGDTKWEDIEPVKIRFKNNFQISDNIFNLGRIDFKLYVSYKVKNSFEDNGITGLDFAESSIFE